MKILQLDVNSIAYEPVKKEAAVFEEAEQKRVSVSDALVLFVSIEDGDTTAIAQKAVSEAVDFAGKQKITKLVIYPFAHLSDKLMAPKDALEILKAMRKAAEGKNLQVTSAPFGWTKKLDLDVKGHPLAEMSRSYTKKGSETVEIGGETQKPKGIEESAALKEEEKVKSTWYILGVDGTMTPVEKFDFNGHDNLQKFATYEMAKVRAYQKEPPHIKMMRKLQLVDYEPGSDPGNMRFYPSGRMMKSMLERYVTDAVIDYGAVEVETPIMYDYTHPALKEYLSRFPARHYIVKSDEKEYFLRFAACFGQFLMMHDATISYRQLPFKVYELARYSFRREKSGELAGLRRLRAFTMPDMHTMCADEEQAKVEFFNQFSFCQKVMSSIGIMPEDYEAAIRFTEQFWKENADFIRSIVRDKLKKPALIETWSFRYAYFDPKFEFNVIDTMGKAAALATVQIDHENAERYALAYVDKDGKKKKPTILHCSASGAIERDLYAMLELNALKEEAGKTPSFPLWLTPVQVRIVPISEKYVDKAIELAMKMRDSGVRVDVDDTDEKLNKKVRNAELDWVPYICVVGEKELASGKLAVRTREDKGQKDMGADDLVNEISDKTRGMPKGKLTLQMLLTKRPTFVG